MLTFFRKVTFRIPYEKLGIRELPEIDGIRMDGVVILKPESFGLPDAFGEKRLQKLLLINLVSKILTYAGRTEFKPVHMKPIKRSLFGSRRDVVLSTLELVPYILLPSEPENYRIKLGATIVKSTEPTIFKLPIREEHENGVGGENSVVKDDKSVVKRNESVKEGNVVGETGSVDEKRGKSDVGVSE